MNNAITISFDFDGCLSLQEVQDKASGLIESGYNVIVTTSRMKEHKNQDLYNVVDALKIKTIVFTDLQKKAPYMYDIDVHVDNDRTELLYISRTTSCEVVDNTNKDWIRNLDGILKIRGNYGRE
jgi:hypothetical protein